MLTEFKIPELGENIKTGTVVKIAVAVGGIVKKEQTLIELETEKASIEIPSPVAGVIKEILIKEGAEVKVNQVIMRIDTSSAVPVSETKKTEPPSVKPPPPVSSQETRVEEKSKTFTAGPSTENIPSPSSAAQPAGKSTPSSLPAEKDVPAAPSVRRFAREIGINISAVPGTGSGGRISLEDVKGYAKQLNLGRSAQAVAESAVSRPLPDFAKWGTINRQPMNNIRKKTAEHLSNAWTTIPHVTQFDKADITELEKLRKNYSTAERKLTISPFLLKVIASGLKVFPQFNASVDMARNEIIYKQYYHLGVAVDTDRGLIVPVIRDVDQKSIIEIAVELNGIAERARNKKTTIEEMQGGCLTLTNLGGIGGTSFTPIVNWPEVAILGLSRSQWEPVYRENEFVPRLMLPLSLSYDHRLIDGADGARFLRWICEAIQQPFLLEMGK